MATSKTGRVGSPSLPEAAMTKLKIRRYADPYAYTYVRILSNLRVLEGLR